MRFAMYKPASCFLLLVIWSIFAVPFAVLFSDVEPYMDEIFHIPQASYQYTPSQKQKPFISLSSSQPGHTILSRAIQRMGCQYHNASWTILRGIRISMGARCCAVSTVQGTTPAGLTSRSRLNLDRRAVVPRVSVK